MQIYGKVPSLSLVDVIDNYEESYCALRTINIILNTLRYFLRLSNILKIQFIDNCYKIFYLIS
jgi:hypothetical protein